MATHSSILAWRIPMDRGAWWAVVHGVTKSQTRLSDEALHSLGGEWGGGEGEILLFVLSSPAPYLMIF